MKTKTIKSYKRSDGTKVKAHKKKLTTRAKNIIKRRKVNNIVDRIRASKDVNRDGDGNFPIRPKRAIPKTTRAKNIIKRRKVDNNIWHYKENRY